MHPIEESNFQLFRDILSSPLIEKSSTTTTSAKKTRKNRGGRKRAIKPVITAPEIEERDDAEEFGEFIDYTAAEIFSSLPLEIRALTYSTWLNTPSLQVLYPAEDPLSPSRAAEILDVLPGSIADTLTTYSLLSTPTNPYRTLTEFLAPILASYLSTLLTPPPLPGATKVSATECETCGRDWIPLTYHHLIPKEVHAKVLKRGWHTKDKLNDVAWLCRACHSFVHRVASNEELAKEWFSVERLMEREDVKGFAKWVGGVRWKAR